MSTKVETGGGSSGAQSGLLGGGGVRPAVQVDTEPFSSLQLPRAASSVRRPVRRTGCYTGGNATSFLRNREIGTRAGSTAAPTTPCWL